MNTEFQALILAAGKGTRMKSDRAKVLHEVAGLPMIGHVIDSALNAGASRAVVILGHQKETVETWLQLRYGDKVVVVEQTEQLGTGHAVWSATPALEHGPVRTLILSGDVPNLRSQTLRSFIEVSGAHTFSMITANLDDPSSYGRVVRNDDGFVAKIVEFRDANELERGIPEINAGCYLADSSFLNAELTRLCSSPPSNAAGEYYLTDLIAVAAQKGDVFGWPIPTVEEIQGVNTRVDLAEAERFAREQINHSWMLEGVTFIDPNNTFIDASVRLSSDVILHPGVIIRGSSQVGPATIIESGSVLQDAELGAHVHIKPYCVITSSTVGDSSAVGPFAHLRPESTLGKNCRVGNFVETKKTSFGDGAKASHLTYLGDAKIGAKANVGAGTITCNYDGKNKNQTTIGAGAFVGSNTALVAPVTIGEGAYIGAGSVITNDVPDGALGVARGRQQNIENWARRRRGHD
jgi:bifunctional UDP-N-acetylglucosamine pyrophosphorylase/glucosamine-1-phosphate N-acetyltransferase